MVNYDPPVSSKISLPQPFLFAYIIEFDTAESVRGARVLLFLTLITRAPATVSAAF